MIKKELQQDLEIETAKRIEKLDKEMEALEDFKLTMFENTEKYDQIIMMKNIKAVAKCEHHHCEFTMKVHAGYIPQEWLIGASKFNRTVRKHAHLNKKTLQERVTKEILNDLMSISPKGAMVVVEGRHSCIAYRGVRDDSVMITSAVGGVFANDPGAKAEFMSLLKLNG
jgi:GTP cyclohydrolase I